MVREGNFKHGGARAGAGRKPSPNSKVQIAVKLDRDLSEVFNSPQFTQTGVLRGQYINLSIREKMQMDGLLSSDDGKTCV